MPLLVYKRLDCHLSLRWQSILKNTILIFFAISTKIKNRTLLSQLSVLVLDEIQMECQLLRLELTEIKNLSLIKLSISFIQHIMSWQLNQRVLWGLAISLSTVTHTQTNLSKTNLISLLASFLYKSMDYKLNTMINLVQNTMKFTLLLKWKWTPQFATTKF